MPEEARACSATMSKWIDENREPKAAKGRKARENARPGGEGEDGGGEDAAEEEIGERSGGRGRAWRPPDGLGNGHAVAHSLRQQGDRVRTRMPATRREAGTRRPGPILAPSASADGCNAVAPGSSILSWRSRVSFRRSKPRPQGAGTIYHRRTIGEGLLDPLGPVTGKQKSAGEHRGDGAEGA